MQAPFSEEEARSVMADTMSNVVPDESAQQAASSDFRDFVVQVSRTAGLNHRALPLMKLCQVSSGWRFPQNPTDQSSLLSLNQSVNQSINQAIGQDYCQCQTWKYGLLLKCCVLPSHHLGCCCLAELDLLARLQLYFLAHRHA